MLELKMLKLLLEGDTGLTARIGERSAMSTLTAQNHFVARIGRRDAVSVTSFVVRG
jgi:hypothetical protein